MKNTVIPATCSLALAGMSAAGLSHWWSVLECTVALHAPAGPSTLTLSLPPAPAPAAVSPAAVATAVVEPAAAAAPGAAPKPESPVNPNPVQAAPPTAEQREFYVAMLDEMRQLKKENLALRDQMAETNRDLMKLEFRVDTHSESFRPLPTTTPEPDVAPPAIDDGTGLLPPVPAVSSLSE